MADEQYGERWDVYCAFPDNVRSILDVGCGEGLGFASWRTRGVEVIGVDILPEFVDAARQRLCDARVMNVETDGWPAEFHGRFDVVAFCDCLEHLRDPWAALANVRPLLRPGGVVVASIPNLRQLRILGKTILGRWDYVDGPGTLQRDHIRFFSGRTVRLMFREAGYAPEFYWPQKTFHLRKPERILHSLTFGRLAEFLYGSYTVAARPVH